MKRNSKQLRYKAIADIILHLSEWGYHIALTKNDTYLTANMSGVTLLLYGDELSEKPLSRTDIVESLIDQNSASRYTPVPCEECEGGGYNCETCLGDGYILKEVKS